MTPKLVWVTNAQRPEDRPPILDERPEDYASWFYQFVVGEPLADSINLQSPEMLKAWGIVGLYRWEDVP